MFLLRYIQRVCCPAVRGSGSKAGFSDKQTRLGGNLAAYFVLDSNGCGKEAWGSGLFSGTSVLWRGLGLYPLLRAVRLYNVGPNAEPEC
jgi:hypothetical protein